jgi:hypothetical protein
VGRKKHADGRAGTWTEVKIIHGLSYVYERTRVYEGGRARIVSRYIGRGRRGEEAIPDAGEAAKL